MRVVKDPDTRKQEILVGALRVFAQKGYDKATIADISKELGISQGLCYRYYASKQEIYDAALEEYATIIANSNLERFNDDKRSFKEKILAYSGSMKEYRKPETENELLYDLFHSEKSQKMHDQLMLKVSSKIVPRIKGELSLAKDRGEISITDIDAFAYFFVYGQMGMLLEEGGKKNTTQRIQELLIELLDM